MSVVQERRRLLLAGAAVVAVLLAGVIFAAHDAKHRILQALGSRTSVGSISLQGSLTPAAHDASLAIRLNGVDMTALQPYLLRLGERPVRHGRLDLTLDAVVANRRVHAPGQLTITGLEFGDGESGTFGGVERRAVLAALKRDGRIALKFTLDGRTDDPKFSLDENLGVRVTAGLGEAVGVSVKGVVEGVGSVLKGLLGAKGDTPAR